MVKDKKHPWFVELEDISVPEIVLDRDKIGLAKMQLDALKIRILKNIDTRLEELISHLKETKNG